jgi:hypothetical protein
VEVRQLTFRVERNPDQIELPFGDLSQPAHAVGATIQERFQAFHEANPWVLNVLEQLTADMLAKGHRRIGIRMLWEVLRWQYNRRTIDPSSSFKVNDQYHSRYVRLLIERHPEWADVFSTRILKAA